MDMTTILKYPYNIAYNISMKQNFMLRAALMWTINDFPVYKILSGWMTQEKIGMLKFVWRIQRHSFWSIEEGTHGLLVIEGS